MERFVAGPRGDGGHPRRRGARQLRGRPTPREGFDYDAKYKGGVALPPARRACPPRAWPTWSRSRSPPTGPWAAAGYGRVDLICSDDGQRRRPRGEHPAGLDAHQPPAEDRRPRRAWTSRSWCEAHPRLATRDEVGRRRGAPAPPKRPCPCPPRGPQARRELRPEEARSPAGDTEGGPDSARPCPETSLTRPGRLPIVRRRSYARIGQTLVIPGTYGAGLSGPGGGGPRESVGRLPPRR